MAKKTKSEMKKIARAECINMLGADFVEKYKDFGCSFYGMIDGRFSFGIGINTQEREFKLGDETPFPYYAVVWVDPDTGKVTRNMEKSILPEINVKDN